MTTVCKCTITRPSLDSLFVFEHDTFGFKLASLHPDIIFAAHATTVNLESKLSPNSPKIILHRYEEFITWAELIKRKNELRPDLKYRLDQLGIFNIVTPLDIYGEGPLFNPFSLTHTRNAEYETFEDWQLNYDWVFGISTDSKSLLLEKSLNTVDEELYIDGILTEYNDFKGLY
jgi:hypothetical protein